MSDPREVLEMAAKAAGFKLDGLASKHIVQGVGPDDFLIVNEKGGHSVWNPIDDDGDCARLESALLIELFWHDDAVQAHRRADSFGVYEDFKGRDRNAVRRLVSISVAARIGRAMP